MSLPFRLIDTGLRGGRANIAFDAAMIELHRAGHIPDTIRFLQFEPTALVGRHQAVSRELNLTYCRDNGIALARRITGGGAIYFDQGMLGWELVLSRRRMSRPSLADYTRAICESVAGGISRAFAIDARYRPRNDIEVDGRKLSGTGGFFDGDTLFYQGTVLMKADPTHVMSCLNVPRAKLIKHYIDRPEARIVTLHELMGEAPSHDELKSAIRHGLEAGLGLTCEDAPVSHAEEERAAELYANEIGTDDFVFEIDTPDGGDVRSASATGPGGTVTAYIRIEGPAQLPRIREALITGDFFVTPPRLVLDLEAALRGVPTDNAGAAVIAFFKTITPDLLSITPDDFRLAVERAASGNDTNGR